MRKKHIPSLQIVQPMDIGIGQYTEIYEVVIGAHWSEIDQPLIGGHQREIDQLLIGAD